METLQPFIDSSNADALLYVQDIARNDVKDGPYLTMKVDEFHLWKPTTFTLSEILDILFFDMDTYKGSINLLTQNGTQRKLSDVASNYENLKPSGQLDAVFVYKIESIIAELDRGVKFPPMLVVTGRNALSSKKYFLDGNHRGLAIAVWSLRNPGNDSKPFDAYLGRKSIRETIKEKVGGVLKGRDQE